VNLSPLLDEILAIARGAGRLVMDVYATPFEVARKADDSPVTEADRRAEEHIVSRLARLDPGVPIVAEESAADGKAPAAAARFWLVDPLDGTKEFASRNGEFTINIALVEGGEPTLGVVLAPALGQAYGGQRGFGAFAEAGGQRRPIACRLPPAEGLTVVSSRSHGDAQALERFLGGQRVARSAFAGSSLKFCLVATGAADLYPRLGRTMEWDTAAGHAVLASAGGRVLRLEGAPLQYGKPQFENPHFVALGARP
jgi:3'(2'), 5'-bisphosphate nucleotidase